jgi:hypothetical protein
MEDACDGSNAITTKFQQSGQTLRQHHRIIVAFVTCDSGQRFLLLRRDLIRNRVHFSRICH